MTLIISYPVCEEQEVFFRSPNERFIHDCGIGCEYKGSTKDKFGVYDWYHCANGITKPFGGSIIKRFGSNGPEYTSCDLGISHSHVVQEALVHGILKIVPADIKFVINL